MNTNRYLNASLIRVNEALAYYLPAPTDVPNRLHEAMRYAVLNGGKRLRPLLVYAAGAALDVPAEKLDAPASAVEMIHAYSLIHDDLPSMDNDDLRRGQPTCHKAFDEATAILAGDALQALAFEILSQEEDPHLSSKQRLAMIATLSEACGSYGMAGGQALDLAATGNTLDLQTLETIHHLKTGALIQASICLGALACDAAHEVELENLLSYAHHIGLAFQIQDDILDIESNTETLGKKQGADLALNKVTYPSLMGISAAKQKIQELYETTLTVLEDFGDRAAALRHVAEVIVCRNY